MNFEGRNIQTLFTILAAAAVTLFNYEDINLSQRVINVPDSEIQGEYDFIVIGAGSAGSVMASRLSEIANWTVLLIEAGGDETSLTDIPMDALYLIGSNFDWNYTTVPQPNACQSSDGVCSLPRGKIVGGSSTISFMIYARGRPSDYDNWSSMGNDGWSYKEVLPYFLKSEDNQDINSPYHARGGYLTVGRSPYLTPMAPLYVEAGEELGYPNVDINGPNSTGFTITQGTIRNGTRCSAGKAFLRPARRRKNLNVVLHSLATKINFDNTKTATGVTFIRNNTNFTVRARKEVIISGGAYNSPQLLMLSGIGLQEHLETIGISLVQHLHVGDNLHDHLGVPALFTVEANVTINMRTSFQNMSAILDYAKNGRGPLTSMIGFEGLGFVNLHSGDIEPDTEMELYSFFPEQNGNMIFVGVYSLNPKSRGTLRLKDRSPTSMPLIDPNYLSTTEDLNRVIAALKFLFQWTQTKTMQRYGIQFYSQAYDRCKQNSIDDFLLCVTNQYSQTAYHPVGTCKMGPPSDPTAVVDSRLRVYGVNHLRVVDASIIPRVVGGNTNAPVIMIAERAADFIKQDYGQPIYTVE